ncbi:MAG: hypothetical protein LBF22_14000 [Deltaproteobacteria bacterium]|nr:hypothetical protein [Deltaproteobacteria bacterium]
MKEKILLEFVQNTRRGKRIQEIRKKSQGILDGMAIVLYSSAFKDLKRTDQLMEGNQAFYYRAKEKLAEAEGAIQDSSELTQCQIFTTFLEDGNTPYLDELETIAARKILKDPAWGEPLALAHYLKIFGFVERDELVLAEKHFNIFHKVSQRYKKNDPQDPWANLFNIAIEHLIIKFLLNKEFRSARAYFQKMDAFSWEKPRVAHLALRTSDGSSASAQGFHKDAPRGVFPFALEPPKLTLVGGNSLGENSTDTKTSSPKTQERFNIPYEISRLMGFYSPAEARITTAYNIIVFMGFKNSFNEARNFYESLSDDPYLKETPPAREKLITAMIYATSLTAGNSLKTGKYLEGLLNLTEDPLLRARSLLCLIFSHSDDISPQVSSDYYEELNALPLGNNPDFLLILSRATTLMIEIYSRRLDFDRVKELYSFLDTLGEDPKLNQEKLRASIEIISTYARAGELDFALELYRPLSYLDGFTELNVLRVDAAVSLTIGYTHKRLLKEAVDFFHFQNSLEVPLYNKELFSVKVPMTHCGIDLVELVEVDLLRFQVAFKSPLYLAVERAEAAVCLIEALGKSKEVDTASDVYQIQMKNYLTEHKLFAFVRMGLIVSLFNVYLKNKQIDMAEYLFFDESTRFKDYDELQMGRATMAISLLIYHSQQDNIHKARQVLDCAVFPGDGPGALEARESLLGFMIHLYAIKGYLKKAAQLLQKFNESAVSENHKEIRARAALSLAEAYIQKGQCSQVQELYFQGSLTTNALQTLPARIMVICSLITNFCQEGNLDGARELYDQIPLVLNKKPAIYRVKAAMDLYKAYIASKNKEGIEYMQKCFAHFSRWEKTLLNSFKDNDSSFVEELLKRE